MRKFIYLFMFLFACTSYAQTEQISGQFRLIGTQEQPQADKVLTIDDNGDVGYNTLEGVNSNVFSVGIFTYKTDDTLSNGALMPLESEVFLGSESMFSNPSDGRIAISQNGIYKIEVNVMIRDAKSAGTVTILSNEVSKTMQVSSSGRQYYYSFFEEFDVSSPDVYIRVINAFQSSHYEVIIQVQKIK